MSTTTYTYTNKHTWVDSGSATAQDPAINATNLNQIENQIDLYGNGLNGHTDKLLSLNNAEVEIYNGSISIPSGWSHDDQNDWYYKTINVTGVTSSTDVKVQFDNAYLLKYADVAVLAPGTGTLTFIRTLPVTEQITGKVSVRGVVPIV